MSFIHVNWSELLETLLEGKDLSTPQASSLMNAWLEEQLQPAQTGAFLSALRCKGLTGEELASMANVLREACPLPCEIPTKLMVDTCGTGGDGADTFNISTAVAFTTSACGAIVAKHGNRSASGKVGSADVLEGLGLALNAPLETVVAAIEKVGISFLFAPAWHPALVNLAPIRKSLGVRTAFNLLGPLVNPLRPKAQVLGVAKSELLNPMAEALQKLGLQRAVVVYGSGGLDEASLSGPNHLRLLANGELTAEIIDPLQMGLTTCSNEVLKGGDLAMNKEILLSVLQGKGSNAQRDVVALNSALVLWASGIENNFQSGLDCAFKCLNQGLPWLKFLELKEFLETKNQ